MTVPTALQSSEVPRKDVFECYVSHIARTAVLVGNLISLPGCGRIAGKGYKESHFVACLLPQHLSSLAALEQTLRAALIIFTH